MAIELTQEIGRHITMVTEDPKETTYLFQQNLSMALQKGMRSPSEILYSPSNNTVAAVNI